MGMDVGDDGQFPFAALRPELGEGVAVQNAHAAAVGVGVEFVIVDRVGTSRAPSASRPSRKAPDSCRPLPAAFKLADDVPPAPCTAAEAVLRRHECPNSRFD